MSVVDMIISNEVLCNIKSDRAGLEHFLEELGDQWRSGSIKRQFGNVPP